MSDLCIYELEENVWDEFSESDDHIVPHPAEEREDRSRFVSDNWKKPRLEIVGSASNVGGDTRFTLKKEENNLPALIKKDMGPWSDAPDGVFTSCNDGSAKEDSSIVCKEIEASNNCLQSSNADSVGDEFTAEGTMLGEKSAVDNNDTYSFALGQISSADNGLNFFDNDSKDKEDGDILYYGWPDDIGNFEDVDRMFRNCDSTFGLGSLSNEDDLCWFPSHSTEGEDALKLSGSEESALNCISDNTQAPKLNSADTSVSDAKKRSLLSGDNSSANTNNLAGHLQISNGSDTRSTSKDASVLKEQVNPQKSRAKHRNHLEGKKKTGGSFHRNSKQFSNTKSPLGELSSENFPPHVKQGQQTSGKNSVNYIIDYGQSSDLTSVGLPYRPPNQVQSIRSQLLEAPAVINENKEKLYQQQLLQSHYSKNLNNASPAAFYDPVHNQTRQPEYEVEGQNEFEAVSIGFPAELDSSNALESSCVSSVLDDVSLEASSFRQLQQVMEQLDIRTKLCIRDSLYRLARSAEQRHNCVNGDQDTNGAFIAEETDKSTPFLDIETDTNPIDRSIAHLLFHRPSDSTLPATDTSSLKPHTMVVHGSTTKEQEVARIT